MLAIVSAVSLIALAFLQYRWITQLGASERALLDESIKRGTQNFREEFNTEISEIVQRTMDGDERNVEARVSRFRSAAASIRHPQIVKAIYVVSSGNVFEGTTTQLKPVEWPVYLLPLRDQLLGFDDGGPPPHPFWNESPPTVVVPAMGGPPRRGRRDDPPEGPRPPDDHEAPPPGPQQAWIAFEFDQTYIGNQFVPELIAKHFGPGYGVAIVSTESDVNILGTRIDSPDAQVGFFEVHLRGPRDRPSGSRVDSDRDRNPRPPRHRERHGEPHRDGPPQPSQFAYPRWQLLIKHQAGSLDLQVAGARHRNLAITFAVLFMMGLSSAALVVWLKRAEQLNRMQMDFVAGVSHELRTPLSVIRAAGENLADGVVASEKQIRNYGALVRDEGKRLSTMVEQILRFAGTDAGRAPYTFTAVLAETLVDRALEGSVDLLADVEVEKQVEHGLPRVMADEASLSHCLQNLLGNAVKYGDGKWVKVEALRKGEEIEFAVTDRGPGVDLLDKPNLFDAFFRGKKAISDQVHGLGIGLSLVKRVAEAHGGRADVQNLKQGGARFSIFIPVARQEQI